MLYLMRQSVRTTTMGRQGELPRAGGLQVLDRRGNFGRASSSDKSEKAVSDAFDVTLREQRRARIIR